MSIAGIFSSNFYSMERILAVLSSINPLLWLSFFICLSLTAVGMLAVWRVNKLKHQSLQYFLYAVIFLYAFGYYSLWSRTLLPYFLPMEYANQVISWVTAMGAPFFMLGLLMQLLWLNNLRLKPVNNVAIAAVLMVTTLVALLVVVDWGSSGGPQEAYSLVGAVAAVVMVGILVSGKTALVIKKWKVCLAVLIACSGLLNLSYFTPLAHLIFYDGLFVLLFFLLHTALAVVFVYGNKPAQERPPFEVFVHKYQITKREADIIEGIYAGKTNQEIANQLFISLQTVKDHASRIYQKTQLRNRAQLTALLRKLESESMGS